MPEARVVEAKEAPESELEKLRRQYLEDKAALLALHRAILAGQEKAKTLLKSISANEILMAQTKKQQMQLEARYRELQTLCNEKSSEISHRREGAKPSDSLIKAAQATQKLISELRLMTLNMAEIRRSIEEMKKECAAQQTAHMAFRASIEALDLKRMVKERYARLQGLQAVAKKIDLLHEAEVVSGAGIREPRVLLAAGIFHTKESNRCVLCSPADSARASN